MEHIKDILAKVTANSLAANNGSLHPMVQNAIDKSKVSVDTLGYSLVVHVPATKLSEAKPYIHQLTKPYYGHNASPSDGNWWDSKKK